MPIRVRQVYDAGATLSWSLERPADGVWYDFSDSTFKASPTTRRRAAVEGTGDLAGRYSDDLVVTPQATFADGSYVLYIHDAAIGDQVVSGMPFRMAGGDVASGASSGSGVTAADVWSFASRSLTDKSGFSMATPPPTAGAIAAAVWDEAAAGHAIPGTFGSRLDAAISSRSTYAGGPVASVTGSVTVGAVLDKSGYSLAVPPPTAAAIADAVWDEAATEHASAGSFGSRLGAAISTRSTFAGGAVASVTSPVIVGSSLDKSGYTLAATGLDSIVVEPGVNLRQAMAPVLAASAGVVLGAGTGTIVIKGANGPTTRITASTDNAGNRTAVTLNLPA